MQRILEEIKFAWTILINGAFIFLLTFLFVYWIKDVILLISTIT